jgi:hypothetical protein
MSRAFLGPMIVALAATVAVLVTIAPDGFGPGATCDELYHVYQGKELVTAFRQQGLEFFTPANINKNFHWERGGAPVQAPLGHWILGWAHYVFDPMPDNPASVSLTSARFAPAIAFGLLIFMVGGWTARREGVLAGTMAAVAVALMPRLFGHAHLAALDMLTTLFFVAAVLAAIEASRGGRSWQFALAGVVWGAAILVRLHGLLLAPPVLCWLISRTPAWESSFRASWALQKWVKALLRGPAVWVAAGVITFVAGWPWLWLAPLERFQLFLASGSARMALHTFYLGQVWADRDVPWHYPWVVSAATVPVGLLVLGLIGLWGRFANGLWSRLRGNGERPAQAQADTRAASGEQVPKDEGILLICVAAFVLTVFSWPGVPVYDGERLFLMVFPLWAVWAGIGARCLVEARSSGGKSKIPWNLENSEGRNSHHATIGSRRVKFEQQLQEYHRKALASHVAHRAPADAGPVWGQRWHFGTVAILVFVALQATGLIVYYPCHLSYYNLLVGGVAGAERLGFEATYWGDTVREPMLAEAVRLTDGKPIVFSPNLAPFQVSGVEISSPALHAARVALVGWDPSDAKSLKGCRYAIVYHRRADLVDVEWILKHGRVVEDYSNQGVWLAKLIELDTPLDVHAKHIRIDGLPREDVDGHNGPGAGERSGESARTLRAGGQAADRS